MFLSLALTLSLLAIAVLGAGVVRALGSRHLRSGSIFSRAVQHTLAQNVAAERCATDIMFGTANSPRAAQGGWTLIDRNLRTRRAVRLAAR